MTALLDLRSKFFEIYRKHDRLIVGIIKAILFFMVYITIMKKVGFNRYVDKYHVIIILSVISSFLPSSVSMIMAIAFSAISVYPLSPETAILVVIVAVIVYSFFMRYAMAYSYVEVFTVSMCFFGMPFFSPVLAGLFGTPLMAIPVCTGIFSYYLLDTIQSSLTVIQNSSATGNPYLLFRTLTDALIKNEKMYIAMAVALIVILLMCLMKSIKMDYSFEIAIVSGSFIMMFVYIICMLRWDVDFGIIYTIIMSAISGLIALIGLYLIRPLNYSGSEILQFEDDDYLYYVKAVPKIKLTSSRTNVTRIVGRTHDDDVEQD